MPDHCRFCGAALPDAAAQVCPVCRQPLGPVPGTQVITPPRLFVRIPGQAPREVLLNRPVLTVGRRPDNDLVLTPPYVSGYHGRLALQGGAWHYFDLGSSNGTFVNGQRVESAVLRDGDILRTGDPHGNSVSLTFRTGGPSPVAGPASTTIPMGSTALGSKPTLAVGRDPRADVPLAAPTVSWRHARIDRTPQGHVLVDLNSTNGTFVNGQRLAHPHLLRQGDVVQIGPFKLEFGATDLHKYRTAGGVRLDAVQLVRQAGRGRQQKPILRGVSLSVYPREMVALVGRSGAGKTTLLNALSGFTRAQGQVWIDGEDLYRRFDLYRTMIGYVPQDDIVHRELSVAQALRYAARLRLPADTSGAEIQRRIEAVLRQVGLGGQGEQPIRSLSGGERKRVSIAMELLGDPAVLFLDEPTSGLDPGLEKQMMHTLRRLADAGRTVVLVTHATANISQCDQVCFLAKGRLVYFGPPEEALAFFGVTSGDLADIYDQLDDPDPRAAQEKAARWEQHFRQSPQYRHYVVGRQSTLPKVQRRARQKAARRRPRANPLRQFLILSRRYLDVIRRDRLVLGVLLTVMPLIGLMLLLIASPYGLVGEAPGQIEQQLRDTLAGGAQSATYMVVGETQLLLFLMALAAVMLGLFAASYEIAKERAIYWRERMANLQVLPYLASKAAVLGGFALLQCLLLLLVVNQKVYFPAAGVFLPAGLEMYVTLVLAALASIALGLLLSSLVLNTNAVIYVVLGLLFFQTIFAGVFFGLGERLRPLFGLALTHWTVQGLGTSVDMEGLNDLTVTLFQPEPREVERPAPGWEPVTVTTATQQIQLPCSSGEVLTVPLEVPAVTVNPVVTVTEVVELEPVLVSGGREFHSDYTRTPAHLCWNWLVLALMGLACGGATALVLKLRDVR